MKLLSQHSQSATNPKLHTRRVQVTCVALNLIFKNQLKGEPGPERVASPALSVLDCLCWAKHGKAVLWLKRWRKWSLELFWSSPSTKIIIFLWYHIISHPKDARYKVNLSCPGSPYLSNIFQDIKVLHLIMCTLMQLLVSATISAISQCNYVQSVHVTQGFKQHAFKRWCFLFEGRLVTDTGNLAF